MLGQQEWKEELQFDAITCMFAIHYFFESEKAIKTFLHNVSINLKEGTMPGLCLSAYHLSYKPVLNHQQLQSVYAALRACFTLTCVMLSW